MGVEKMSNGYITHNGSGYVDPTVDAVIKHESALKAKQREDARYHNMAKVIKTALESNGYVLDGPINLVNTNTGHKRRIY